MITSRPAACSAASPIPVLLYDGGGRKLVHLSAKGTIGPMVTVAAADPDSGREDDDVFLHQPGDERRDRSDLLHLLHSP